MKKIFFLLTATVLLIFFTSSCGNSDTAERPPYWKLISTEKGTVEQKLNPEIKGPFLYPERKGTAHPIYVINGKAYQSGERLEPNDTVLLSHYVYTGDSTKTKTEISRL